MTPLNPDRRQFLAGSAALAAGLASTSAAAFSGRDNSAMPGLTDTSSSPHVKVRSVGLNEVKWTRGFWADRFASCRDVMVPNLGRIMQGTEPSQFLENFRIAAGQSQGRHRGPSWNDGDFLKWLEAAAAVYAITKDPALDAQMDAIIGVIAQAQRADGYWHTPTLIRNRDAQAFQNPLEFECYNLGHLITTACVHHRVTGKASLLNVAMKAASFLGEAVQSQRLQVARCSVCPSHYMAMVELYRTTKDPKHLALARELLNLRDVITDGTDDNQDRIPFRQQTAALGHAVRAHYLYAGAADLVAETGDPALLDPLLKIWDDLVHHKLYITGGCGALYDGASPDGASDQKSIARVHQAYGRAFQLPHSTAHNETCAAIGSILWNWRMLAITGEARFADLLELTLFNAALAGISLDGTRFFYTNTLRQLEPMPVPLRWPRSRQPYISCFCCPPNLVRTIAEASAYAYGRSASAVWIHLYGSSVLDTEIAPGARVQLTQETDYPWDGRVRITINKAPTEPCSLHLRIPGWAVDASLKVNGAARDDVLEPASYVAMSRTWSAGDVVELDLPMRARLIQAHPLVEEARNQVAIQRGPIVYCLESTDLPNGVGILDVAIARDIALTARFEPDLLGGLTVLEGQASARREAPWSKQLYRELSKRADSRAFELRLIPYYAWGNRGRSEMTVWLPLDA